ncbi:archaellin/type IV pilin N-terminal domain-containing protein [Archaeoglobus fulgidus]|uniref:Probable flagellin 2 n=1 Tax=Archaeoglobus fulgidus (strain ATCC 49558 / DSM 4304 / JCM 9628 / NBRC 100126 / VC-16) TaxID=224325 RepID=FLAB2_ARCFU|nr:archaellin/type IV pilin N-terminal domain-containing protein [Archaeoglobus fulgidus]O29207.1 RecName: Full=Probable flagellin 2; Flags: Precursor [Archaeoglobus fulgidus DSM 4304]AAB90185.1 flagellin (flaB1-2) [Archaeoglobus fulgidus DSM 4304]
MRVGSRKLRRDEKGFTGLEAAIVLIAFVVVAAVFSYVMLGAGFYTTQKSKKVVDTGVKQASSSLTLDGQYIYLNCTSAANGQTGSSGKVGQVYFYVTQTAGGSPVDLNMTSIAITTDTGFKQLFFNDSCTPGTDCPWWYDDTVGDGDNVVEPNEKYKITIDVNNTEWSGIGELNPNDVVTIEVRPPIGAPLTITKTLPPSFTNLTFV